MRQAVFKKKPEKKMKKILLLMLMQMLFAANAFAQTGNFGIFTDNTPVESGITPGLDSEIYVWEETLTAGTIPPYEGTNGMTFTTTGKGWFGGGIMSNSAIDLSAFENGNIYFRIKIPANVTFEIGLIDIDGIEKYVVFPAGETVFNLERNGEWGQAIIPLKSIAGTSVDLTALSYVFVFLERFGTQCEFAIDDIYYSIASSVNFDSSLYAEDAPGAGISVYDEPAANTTVSVNVSNGTDTISINISLGGDGRGTGFVNFGPTNDGTDTIAVQENDILTATYSDFNSQVRTATANIRKPYINSFGIFTDTTPVDAAVEIGVDARIEIWDNSLVPGTIPPYEGGNALSYATAGLGWSGGAIIAEAPLDFSEFSNGYINFMIKIPAHITFDFFIEDAEWRSSFVTFQGNQTQYGLVRDGEWGRVVIPIQEIKGDVDLSQLSLLFGFYEESGEDYEFAVDDIYWTTELDKPSSVKFNANAYSVLSTGASITVHDKPAANSNVNVSVSNGREEINLSIMLDNTGTGTGDLSFGPTNDTTDTIEIMGNDTLKASYTSDSAGLLTATALVRDYSSEYIYGVFTDETPTDEGVTVGVDASIFVWENTLTAGTIPPFEGPYGMTFKTADKGWFGGGIMANEPQNLSQFLNGYIKFMIKIPSNVRFEIGFIDVNNKESYAVFPANQAAYNLQRNGEWGQAIIPVKNIVGTVDLENLNYVFVFIERNGTQCEFAIDDVYWSFDGTTTASVDFSSVSYPVTAQSAAISVYDLPAAGTEVSVSVTNGTDVINISMNLDAEGNGTGILNFGATDDATDTIAIEENTTLTATYIDSSEATRMAVAYIRTSPGDHTFGIFTDETPVDDGITVGANAAIYVWENTLAAGAILPFEGANAMSFQTTGQGWFGGGILVDTPLDLSFFAEGNINFMIKIPADVTFEIGLTDSADNQSYAVFPAGENKYNLVRNGEWGRAVIPVSEIKGDVDLKTLSYVFVFIEREGKECEFAIDDIYWSLNDTGIEDNENVITEFKLEQNYPNPFNPSTVIRFNLVNSSMVKLEIFDVNGQLVTTLVNSKMDKGGYAVNWNASAMNGRSASSGVYFYRLSLDGKAAATKNMLLMK
jgi:hypothetical protein